MHVLIAKQIANNTSMVQVMKALNTIQLLQCSYFNIVLFTQKHDHIHKMHVFLHRIISMATAISVSIHR